MLKIYGSEQCPDCINCKRDLNAAGVEYLYLNISENLLFLKKFLKLRDENEMFVDIRKSGKIGIPCIVRDDESVTLSWEEYVSQDSLT